MAGRNRIESILGGCALLETWQGAGGGHGRSLNAYDRGRRPWHQTPNADGTVRQLWESSADSGRTGSVAFDGLFVRAAAAR
jgi:hypothetical protein